MGMEEVKELYGAHVRFPKADGEIVFNYCAMEIARHYPSVLETKHYYFTDRNHSTRYFEKGMLDKEYEITDELTVFYSADKSKCVDWLIKKRNAYLVAYRDRLQRLEQSNIRETIKQI